MKFLFLALAGLVFLSASASADVSKDLIFCSQMTPDAAKLACFEAVARKDRPQRSVPPRASTQPRERPVDRSWEPPQVPTSRGFSGPYVFGGAGSYFPTLNRTQPSAFDLSDLNTPFFQAGAGYNVLSGNLIIGAELRANTGDGRISQFNSAGFDLPLSFPFNVGTGCCDPSTPIPTYSHLITGQTIETRDSIEKRGGADGSVRIGAAFGDWLVFGRIGAGVDEIVSSRRTSVATRYCEPSVARVTVPGGGGFYYDVATGCASTSGQLVSSTGRNFSMIPYVVLGAGIERNFGNFFLRGEFDFQAYTALAPYATRASGSIGYRF